MKSELMTALLAFTCSIYSFLISCDKKKEQVSIEIVGEKDTKKRMKRLKKISIFLFFCGIYMLFLSFR